MCRAIIVIGKMTPILLQYTVQSTDILDAPALEQGCAQYYCNTIVGPAALELSYDI